MTTADEAIAAARARLLHWHCKDHPRKLFAQDRHYIESEIFHTPAGNGTRAGWCYDAMIQCAEYHADPLAALIDRLAEAVVLLEAMSPDGGDLGLADVYTWDALKWALSAQQEVRAT